MIEQDVRAGSFDGLAANYQRYRIGYSSGLFDMLETLGIRRGSRVLDAGCGTGISLEPLVARGMQVTGLDLSDDMLAVAKAAFPGAAFAAGRVEAQPFPDRSFDAAVCAQAFHWFDADNAFAELIRVVKPGGPIAVWWKILSSDDGMRALRAAACAQAGVQPAPEPLAGGFGAFYRAPFASRTLRVIPFQARMSIDDWIGYERSRAAARDAHGAKLETYLEALRTELNAKYTASGARFDVRYVQYLYVGTTAQ